MYRHDVCVIMQLDYQFRQALKMSSPPSIFIDTKKERIANCTKSNCGVSGRFMCGRCRRMGQKLCRSYHNISLEVDEEYQKDTRDPLQLSKLAVMEIEARLLYEYVFDFIEKKDLTGGKWLSVCLRDRGHTQRMVKLYKLFIYHVDVLPKQHKWMMCNDV